MEKCRRMKRQRCMSKNCFFLDFESPRKHASRIVARKALRCKWDILMNGSMVKNHILFKTGFGYLATRRTSFLLWFEAYQVRLPDLHQLQRHLRDRRVIPQHLLQARLHHLFENELIELKVTSLQ